MAQMKVTLRGNEAEEYLNKNSLRLKGRKFPLYGLTITLWMIHKDVDENFKEINLITKEIENRLNESFMEAMEYSGGKLIEMRCFRNYVELDILIPRTVAPANIVIGLKTASSRKIKSIKNIKHVLHENKFWAANYDLSQFFKKY